VMDSCHFVLYNPLILYTCAPFAASPAQLGSMTFSRLLAQALASPLGGLLGEQHQQQQWQQQEQHS
jgi:hypothetical protein